MAIVLGIMTFIVYIWGGLMKKIKRLVALWCPPHISNSLHVPLLLTQTLFPFLHEHRLL